MKKSVMIIKIDNFIARSTKRHETAKYDGSESANLPQNDSPTTPAHGAYYIDYLQIGSFF